MSKKNDLLGKRFGKLVVVSELPERFISDAGRKFKVYRCRCDCGREIDVVGLHLRNGNKASCGCYKKVLVTDSSRYDLTGRRFGKLTVIERMPEYFVFPSGLKMVQWRCKCDCGGEVVTLNSRLLKGTTTSCGCAWKCHIGE